MFLRVKEAGRYEVLLEGPEARARIEPFLTYRPERYKSPPFRGTRQHLGPRRGVLRLHRRAREARDRDLHGPRGRAGGPGALRSGGGAGDGRSRGAGRRGVPRSRPRPRRGLRGLPERAAGGALGRAAAQAAPRPHRAPLRLAAPGRDRHRAHHGRRAGAAPGRGRGRRRPGAQRRRRGRGEGGRALARRAHGRRCAATGKDTVQYTLAFEPARLSRATPPSSPPRGRDARGLPDPRRGRARASWTSPREPPPPSACGPTRRGSTSSSPPASWPRRATCGAAW